MNHDIGWAGLAAVAFLAFAWPGLALLGRIFWFDDDHSFAVFIPLVSAFAALEAFRRFARPAPEPSAWGILAGIFGLALTLLGYWYHAALPPQGTGSSLGAPFLCAVGLLSILIGLCVTVGGFHLARRLSFPLAFLGLAIPLPQSLTEPVTLSLRSAVTAMAEWMLNRLDILVLREGNVLHLASDSLGVADACSGVRSLWVLVAFGIAIGHFLECGKRRTAFLAFVAVPAAMAVNLLRVVSSALLIHRFGAGAIEGFAHDALGIAGFGLGLAIMTGSGWSLSGCEPGEDPPPAKGNPFQAHCWRSKDRTKGRYLLGAFSILLFMGLGATHLLRHHYALHVVPGGFRQELVTFPRRIGGFTISGSSDLAEAELSLLKPSDRLVREYRAPSGESVWLKMLFWEPMVSRRIIPYGRPHLPSACYPASGWNIVESRRDRIRITGVPDPVTQRLFQQEGLRRIVLFWYRQTSNDSPTSWANPIADRLTRLVRSWKAPATPSRSQYIVIIETDVVASTPEALDRAIRFARLLSPELRSFGFAPDPAGEIKPFGKL